MGFASSISLQADKMKAEVNTRITQIASELFTTIVENTPVNAAPVAQKRGELKNNWYAGFGTGNYSSSYTTTFDTSGSSSLSQAQSVLQSTDFIGQDGEVSFTNNVPYGYIAEVSGWLPPQWTGKVKPYRMVFNALTTITTKYP